MRIVNVRAHSNIYFRKETGVPIDAAEEILEQYSFNSAPINIGRELVRRGLAHSFKEWRFWGYPSHTYSLNGIPVAMLESTDGEEVSELERHLANEGEPDVIWAEGIELPSLLRQLFARCPNSLKIIYPKYCEPWLIEGLDLYDACLVDEAWQIEEMKKRHPSVNCFVWDKLVDYELQFFPTAVPKEYDICYVARLHPRKYHKLLFTALSRISDRPMSVVLVGSDENECQQYLEPMAKEAGVAVTFTGQVEVGKVNHYINASRIGVICDEHDAVPRAMLEYMAADVPVLATDGMRAGARYIGPKAGMLKPPGEFHLGIIEMLEQPDRFKPREHLLANYSRRLVVDKLYDIITELQQQRAVK